MTLLHGLLEDTTPSGGLLHGGLGNVLVLWGCPKKKTPPARELKQRNRVVSQFWGGGGGWWRPEVRDPGVGRVGSF